MDPIGKTNAELDVEQLERSRKAGLALDRGHECTVGEIRSGKHAGKYRIDCHVCGFVGVPQEFENDADAIAARHELVGGFG